MYYYPPPERKNMERIKIGDFRKKVIEKKSEITDQEFFTSESAKEYLVNLAEAVTGKFGSKMKLHLQWGDPNGSIAKANSREELFINANNPFTQEGERVDKLIALKGLVLHECGHLLFTDFHLDEKTQQVLITRRDLFPTPKAEEDAYHEFITDAATFSQKELAGWAKILGSLDNSIEDGFIENMILSIIPGDGQCLMRVRKKQYNKAKSVKGMRADGLSTSQIVFNMILLLAKYGSVKMDKDDRDDEAVDTVLKSYDLIRKAVTTQKAYNRKKLVNEIFVRLYKYFKEEKEQNDQGQNNQDQNDQDQNQEQQDNQCDQNQGQQDNSKDQEPNDNSQNEQNESQNSQGGQDGQSENQPDSSGTGDGNGSGSSNRFDPNSLDIPEDDIKDDINTGSASVLNDNNLDKNLQEAAPSSNNQERMDGMTGQSSQKDRDAAMPSPNDKRQMESIAEQIAKDEVKKAAEQELADSLKEEAKNLDYGSYNKDATANVTRSFPSENAVKTFERDYADIQGIVKRLVREIKEKIKDKQQGGRINGLYTGRYLDSHSLYRFDSRILCKNDLPEDIPNMAISLVIDASGSMSGPSERYARRTALLLYLFGRELNIPVMVHSHNSRGQCNIAVLADFDSVDGKDKYRICDYNPNGCNRDGMAIRYAMKKLSQRPEETKLCFIISDGLPSAYPSRDTGIADIREVLTDYSKKGVKFIACGLGSDAERIRDIYQKDVPKRSSAEFLNCEHPEELPVTIVRTIRKLIG